MAEEKKLEFSDLQVRECDEIEEPVLPPEYCPTCIPNPNAIVPVWEEEENPFSTKRSVCIKSPSPLPMTAHF